MTFLNSAVIFVLFILIAAVGGGLYIYLTGRRSRSAESGAKPSGTLDGWPAGLANDQSFADYAQSKFVEIDGIKIHYFQEGRGTDILLVHGIGASTTNWALVFHELTKTYRVTAIDLPGFGRSDKRLDVGYGLDEQAQRLALFIRRLGLAQTHIVGHSMGGAIATWMAHENPELVNKLLLIAPALNRWIVALHPSLLTWFMHATKTFIVNKNLIRWMYLKRVTYRPPKHIEQFVEAHHRPFANSPEAVEAFWRHSYLLRDRRLPHGITDLKAETLILMGDHDKVFPARYLKPFLKNNSNIKLITIKDCGHLVMEEHPHEFLKLANEFFRE